MTWLDALDKGERRIARREVPFTEVQVKRAQSWVTCACGEQDARIPRHNDAAPEDEYLTEFGNWFAAHVREARWRACRGDWEVSARYVEFARKTLASIEARAATLLRAAARKAARKRKKVRA